MVEVKEKTNVEEPGPGPETTMLIEDKVQVAEALEEDTNKSAVAPDEALKSTTKNKKKKKKKKKKKQSVEPEPITAKKSEFNENIKDKDFENASAPPKSPTLTSESVEPLMPTDIADVIALKYELRQAELDMQRGIEECMDELGLKQSVRITLSRQNICHEKEMPPLIHVKNIDSEFGPGGPDPTLDFTTPQFPPTFVKRKTSLPMEIEMVNLRGKNDEDDHHQHNGFGSLEPITEESQGQGQGQPLTWRAELMKDKDNSFMFPQVEITEPQPYTLCDKLMDDNKAKMWEKNKYEKIIRGKFPHRDLFSFCGDDIFVQNGKDEHCKCNPPCCPRSDTTIEKSSGSMTTTTTTETEVSKMKDWWGEFDPTKEITTKVKIEMIESPKPKSDWYPSTANEQLNAFRSNPSPTSTPNLNLSPNSKTEYNRDLRSRIDQILQVFSPERPQVQNKHQSQETNPSKNKSSGPGRMVQKIDDVVKPVKFPKGKTKKNGIAKVQQQQHPPSSSSSQDLSLEAKFLHAAAKAGLEVNVPFEKVSDPGTGPGSITTTAKIPSEVEVTTMGKAKDNIQVTWDPSIVELATKGTGVLASVPPPEPEEYVDKDMDMDSAIEVMVKADEISILEDKDKDKDEDIEMLAATTLLELNPNPGQSVNVATEKFGKMICRGSGKERSFCMCRHCIENAKEFVKGPGGAELLLEDYCVQQRNDGRSACKDFQIQMEEGQAKVHMKIKVGGVESCAFGSGPTLLLARDDAAKQLLDFITNGIIYE